jgi:uncharacterized protein (DUF2147 family)
MGSRPRSGAPGRSTESISPHLTPRRRVARAALVLLLWIAPAHAWAQMAAVGQWLTADGEARVDTFDCQGTLCGRIVWLKQPVDESGRVRRDTANEDAELRIRPILGLPLLTGFTPDGDDRWSDGVVYVPEDGRAYRAELILADANTLLVRRFLWQAWLGWIPGLSRTERWTRVGP